MMMKPKLPVVLVAGPGELSAQCRKPGDHMNCTMQASGREQGTCPCCAVKKKKKKRDMGKLGPTLLIFNKLWACQTPCRVYLTKEPSIGMKWHFTCFQISGSGSL